MIRADRRTMWVFNFILPRLCMDCSLVGGYRSHDPPHNLERRIFFFVCLGSGTVLFFCILWCKSCTVVQIVECLDSKMLLQFPVQCVCTV